MFTLEAERKATKLSRQALEEAQKDASPRERLEIEAQKVRLDARLKALSLPR
jgi:vacuolar-type H+-ATPase subunit E/Vma4